MSVRTSQFRAGSAGVSAISNEIQRLPSMFEDDEEGIYQSPPTPNILLIIG
jgi:hypothetical protein